jgi:DNA mismatch repair protein MSH6
MAKGSGTASSPPASTPALKRSTSSTQNMKNQRSILGFFQKSSPATPSTAPRKAPPPAEPASSPAQRAADTRSSIQKKPAPNLTPAPSSDAIEPDEDDTATPKVRFAMMEVCVEIYIDG